MKTPLGWFVRFLVPSLLIGSLNAGCPSVPGSAKILNGATPEVVSFRGTPPPSTRWLVSPDRVEMQFTSLTFENAARRQWQVPLQDCTATYVRAEPSLSERLDCAFTVPEGSYDGMRLHFEKEIAVLVDDPVNGLFTDGDGIVADEPQGGAIPTQMEGIQDTVRTWFAEPLVVAEDPVEIRVVMSGQHTVDVQMVDGSPSLAGGFGVQLFITPNSVSTAAFYSAAGSAATIPGIGGGNPTELQLFYEDENTASYVFLMPGGEISACGGQGNGFYQAYNTGPSIADENGQRIGGYLGLDQDRTICFALPTDGTYSAYQALFRMTEADAAGGWTTLECQAMDTVPEPVAGADYSSGCPEIVPDAQVEEQLAAE